MLFLLQLALGVFRQLSRFQLRLQLLQYHCHPQRGLLAIRMLYSDLLHFQRMNDLNHHLMRYHWNHIIQLVVLSLNVLANEDASADTPSIKSPSPQIAYV